MDRVEPTCIADADSAFTAGRGTVFATVGTGGTPLRNLNLGDSETGYFAARSGLNLNPTYGLLDLQVTDSRLSAAFVGTSGGTFTDTFTIARPTNQAPVASFSASPHDLAVAVDGSASTDGDGTIAAYAWDFGDGAKATGALPPSHTYGAAGTYTVTLTVTDDQGATGSTTQQVTVRPSNTVGSDSFTRTVSGGWGSADAGGAWTVGPASDYSVDGTAGVIAIAAGTSRSAVLRSVSSFSTDTLTGVAVNAMPGGSGLYVSAVGRWVGAGGDYRGTAVLRSDGQVALRLGRVSAAGVETVLTPTNIVSGVTFTAGSKILLRVETIGASPTQIRARVWAKGTVEPSTWTVSVTDTTAGLQAAGGVGVLSYLSGTAASPVALRVDDLLASTLP